MGVVTGEDLTCLTMDRLFKLYKSQMLAFHLHEQQDVDISCVCGHFASYRMDAARYELQCSVTTGQVVEWRALCTKITEINLSAFAYNVCYILLRGLKGNLYETACK